MIAIGQVYKFKPSGEFVKVKHLDTIGTYRPVVLQDEDGEEFRVEASYLVGWNSFYELATEETEE